MVILAARASAARRPWPGHCWIKTVSTLTGTIVKDRRIIRDIAWPKDASLLVLDELHKAPKWKNLLKGVATIRQQTACAGYRQRPS